jgi:hypothetical protein
MTKRHSTAIPRHALASLPLALALLALTCVPARASEPKLTSANVRPFTFIEPPTTFGEEGTAPGDFGGGENPDSVAVEATTGDVFVFDSANGRVEKFGPHGEFLSEFTEDLERGEEGSLTVDNSPTSPSKGDVYVTDVTPSDKGVIEKFAPAPTKTEPNKYIWVEQLPMQEQSSVAVNSQGDVYAVSATQVTKFGPAGEPLGTAALVNGGFRTFEAAVALDGDLYVARFLGGGSPGVTKVAFAPGPELEVESESVLIGEGDPTAVAVDPSGDIYVDKGFGENVLAEYEPSGKLIEEFGAGQSGFSRGIAFSALSSPGVSGYLYVADVEHHDVHIFEREVEAKPKPRPDVRECVTTVSTPVSASVTCAVNPNALEGSWFLEYGELGSPTITKTPEQKIKSSGNVEVELNGLTPHTKYGYRLVATNENGVATGEEEVFKTPPAVQGVGGCVVPGSEVENEAVTLHGSLEPLGKPTSWYFEYGEGLRTKEEESSSLGKVEPKAKISGLKPNTSYSCKLVAHNEYGTTDGADGEFTTYSPPVFESQSFEKVGSIDATLRAAFDPVDPLGPTLASTYYFEYGPTTKYGLRTPETSVAAGQGTVAATAHLNGLQPDIEYHFRIVMTDARGTTDGPDTTFTTFSTIGSGLPDHRIYEMVSPPEDNNADIYVPELDAENGGQHLDAEGTTATGYPFEVSPEGSAVVYVGDPSFGGNGDIGEGGGNNYLATRTAEGWKASSIMPPVKFAEYYGFSSNLSVGVLTAGGFFDKTPLTEEAPGGGYNVIYTRTMSDGSYHPLFTKTPPNRDPAEFGFHQEETPYEVGSGNSAVLYAGASADFSHILFEADAAFTPEAADPGREANDLYESVDGQLSSVDVLPHGEPAPNATFGGYQPQPESDNGFPKEPDLSRVISADGSRIFWTDLATGDLYVRENGTTTVQVDASKVPAGEGEKEAKEREANSGGGNFQTASSDGSKVFFTDCKRLTTESTAVFSSECLNAGHARFGQTYADAVLSGNDLYEYDVESGELTDLTVDHNASDALGADVQGVIGASEDGEYVYFVADGVLTEGKNAEGKEPVAGDPNLYLSHAGETTFIATLNAESDNPQGGSGGDTGGDWRPTLGRRTAEVTPDGHGVVFETTNSLTGDDNAGFREVYVYDAESGHLVCASCLPTGEPPDAESFLPISGQDHPTFQLRLISEDGSRVFFDSRVGLVAHATDRQTNVYEWERGGAGSCQDSRGCVYVLSGGTSPYGSYLVGASASGDDVFFVTRAQLVQQDDNEAYNLYDAHAGGVLPPAPPECSGTSCQGVPFAPTAFEAPASVTFNGIGNFPPPAPASAAKPKTAAQIKAANLAKARKACRAKKNKRKRAGCEAKARKRYGSSKAEKSNRRAE